MKSLEHNFKNNKGRKGKEENELFRRREPIQANTIHHSPSDVRVLLD
jgi:hypothetical protein